MTTAAKTRNPYRKRPDAGSQITTSRHGIVTVLHVYQDGLRLEVRDRAGRDWTVERASAGCWFVVELASDKEEAQR